MTKTEKAIIDAALALCRAGHGFCFLDDDRISNPVIGRKLEDTCARYEEEAKRRKRK